MRCIRAPYAPLLVCLACLAPAPAAAQSSQQNVEVIVSQAEGAAERPRSIREFFKAIKTRATKIRGHILPMTKCERWSVPKGDVEAVKKAAAERGVIVTELGPNWNRVMRHLPADTLLNDKQKAMMQLATASRATASVKLMAGPPPPVLEYALTKDAKARDTAKLPAKITVALTDDTVYTITRTSVDIRPDMCVWRGVTEQTGALVTLMWWPDGQMAGTVQHPNALYSIRHLGSRLYAMVEMSGDRMPQEHAPIPTRMRSNDPNLRDDPLVQQGDASRLRGVTTGMRPPSEPRPGLAEIVKKFKEKAGASKAVTIDVIVAYTAKAASHYGNVKRELVDLAIEEANESFRMSRLGHIKLKLVHAYQTDYVEEGEHFQHVWRFADKGDGHMEEIHELRDKHRADVGVLIVDDPNGCGLATRVFADADDAFAVVHHECAASTYSLAHEIGHLIGARHDLGTDSSMTPFPYGHGYVNGTKWRDIMSYKESCGGCPRVPVWSSPKVMVKGELAGTRDLDNARVIAEQAARVAAFR